MGVKGEFNPKNGDINSVLDKKDVINKILDYFEKKYGVEAEIEKDKSFTNIIFNDAIELTEEEYEQEFYQFLKGLGFRADDDWEYPITKSNIYWSYNGSEQFKNRDDSLQILTFYTKVSDKDGTSYFLKSIRVEELEE